MCIRENESPKDRRGIEPLVETVAILVSLWMALLAAVSMGLIEHAQFVRNRDTQLYLPAAIALIAVTASPALVSYAIARLVRNRLGPKQFELRLPNIAEGSWWKGARERAVEAWNYERQRARTGLDRMLYHASYFGVIASGMLAGSLIARQRWPKHGGLIVAAVGAAIILAITTMLVRTARNDASVRMFAWAAHSIVRVGIAAVGVAGVMPISPADQPAAQTHITSYIFAGIGVALVGDRVLEWLARRFATAFDLGPDPMQDAMSRIELSKLEGLSSADVERLREEGIDSLSSLAFFPTARLFFNTSHSLQRICDWQDQALLHALLGPERTKWVHEKLGIRGIVDFHRYACELLDLREAQLATSVKMTEKTESPDKLSVFGSDDPKKARATLATVIDHELVRRLVVYSRSTPIFEIVPSTPEPEPRPA